MALSLVSVLTACGASTGSGKGHIDLSHAPLEPLANCERAAQLPERDLTKAEVEAFWESDRVRLTTCFGNVEALLAYIKTLKAGFDTSPKVWPNSGGSRR